MPRKAAAKRTDLSAFVYDTVVSTAIEEITPELAAKYLKQNTDNYRKLSRSVVKRYAEDILAGRWEINGETIVFNEDGVLVNGQHRLAAIIMANRAIVTIVVRGVSRDVTIFDSGSVRTLNQIASHENVDCNPTVSAAANILVNNFTRNHGKSAVIDFIRANIDELNRAYRVACYGSDKGMRSKCAPAVAACYLAIHTQAIPVYEVELFFRIFNAPWSTNAEGYDISPVVTAGKMFDARDTAGYQIQREKLETICLALRDFHEQKTRTDPYKIGEPFYYQTLMDAAHKQDGLN